MCGTYIVKETYSKGGQTSDSLFAIVETDTLPAFELRFVLVTSTLAIDLLAATKSAEHSATNA